MYAINMPKTISHSWKIQRRPRDMCCLWIRRLNIKISILSKLKLDSMQSNQNYSRVLKIDTNKPFLKFIRKGRRTQTLGKEQSWSQYCWIPRLI
jgi:hypothetical protein